MSRLMLAAVLCLLPQVSCLANDVSPGRESVEVRRTLRITAAIIRDARSSPPSGMPERESKRIAKRYDRSAKLVSARSIAYICSHRRFGRSRSLVLELWGTRKGRSLKPQFLVGLLTSDDDRLRVTAIEVIDELLNQGRYRESLGEIARACIVLRARHPGDATSDLMAILALDGERASVAALKDIALSGTRLQRGEAVDDLVSIGSAPALEAVADVERSIETEAKEVRSKADRRLPHRSDSDRAPFRNRMMRSFKLTTGRPVINWSAPDNWANYLRKD